MLMALTAVAVIACRVSPSRQDTTATALASLRNASLVCAASRSSREMAVGIAFTPKRFFFVDAVPYCTLQCTVRYSKNLIECNRKVLRLNLGAPDRKSYADSRR